MPVLLIHGTADTHIPIENSQAIFELLPAEKEFWKVDGAGHVGSIYKKPGEYAAWVG